MGIPSIQGSELEKALLPLLVASQRQELSGIGRKNLRQDYALHVILNGNDSLIQRYRDHLSSESHLHRLLLEDLESNVLTIKQVAGLLLIPENLHSHLLISYDAHASSYQHVSVITCDLRLGKMVNILNDNQQNDFFNDSLSYLLTKISTKFLTIK
jgi:hypothetical protein